MEQKRLNEFMHSALVNATQMAYVEEAHGTLMLLENLNEVFRYQTGKVQSVTLFSELETLERYIAIQKVRYGDRFGVNLLKSERDKSSFLNRMEVITFFDSIFHTAMEQSDSFIEFTLEFEYREDKNRIKLLCQRHNSSECFYGEL